LQQRAQQMAYKQLVVPPIKQMREERMDQGELELLAVTLPNDLAQYVVEDNEAFQKEIVEWDQKQQQIATNNANNIVASSAENNQVVPIASNLFDSSGNNDVLWWRKS